MRRPTIAWLPGDGIGPEVLEGARTVLDAAGFEAEYLHGDIGWEMWRREGDPLPRRTLELLRRTGCAFLGAVTSKPDAETKKELAAGLRRKGARYTGAVLRIRRLFDLYICLRPCLAFPGNPQNLRESIDITLFRENTEGMYSGVESDTVPPGMLSLRGMEKVPRAAAISVRTVTEKASTRIARAAFEFASSRKRAQVSHAGTSARKAAGARVAPGSGRPRKVTAVHKANVLRATDGLFLDSVRRVARGYPSVEYSEMNVDTCALELVRDPLGFDVILTTNLFGDILSDLCAGLVGGMGFAPSANIGERYALFEPAHGSAPDIAGKGVANPLAAILSAGMMLEYLGERRRAESIRRAVADVIKRGKVQTPDMGGSATTKQMAGAVASALLKR